MTGDGKPDLLAIDDLGKLRLYHREGTGGVPGAHDIIGTGGWGSASSVTHRGDWTGDGAEDLVARVGGDLRVYANRGGGSLLAPVTVAGACPRTRRSSVPGMSPETATPTRFSPTTISSGSTRVCAAPSRPWPLPSSSATAEGT